MKLKFAQLSFLFFSAMLTSCTIGSLSADQIESTARSMAETSLAALPSNTIAPTETAQPSSTITLAPSPTPSETVTMMPTIGPTFVPTWTPYGQSDTGTFEEAKSDKGDFNAPLLISNQSGEDVHFILLTPVYQEYDFNGNMTLILPEDTYTFRAKVGKNTIGGSFAITNGDKHVLTLYANRYHFSTP